MDANCKFYSPFFRLKYEFVYGLTGFIEQYGVLRQLRHLLPVVVTKVMCMLKEARNYYLD